MKKILCIGSAGFILGNFVRKIIYGHKESYALVSIDNLTNGDFNTIYTNRYHTFYPADIRDANILNRIFEKEKPDYVIYGASINYASDTYKADVFGINNVMDVCEKYKVSKFIYLSSDQVYAKASNPLSEHAETNRTRSENIYKLDEEDILMARSKVSGMHYNILRLGNTYGNWDRSDKFISKSIRALLNDQPVVVHGDGSVTRDWTYIFDTVSSIMCILEKGQPNEIYNVGAGQEFSVLEVAHMICSIMNKSYGLITFDKVKPNDFSRAMEMDKIEALGWKSGYKLKDGLSETIQWCSNNSSLFKLNTE
jgi:dTDP-glucose 4,6-dehydratase